MGLGETEAIASISHCISIRNCLDMYNKNLLRECSKVTMMVIFFTQGPTVDMDEKVFTLIADVECLRCLYGGT